MASPIISVSSDGISIEREVDAPREAVWACLTEPAHFARWFGSPGASVPLDSVSFDLREGGPWRATMLLKQELGGGEIPWHGLFREIVAPERLAMTLSDQPDPAFEPIVYSLAALPDGRTLLRFRQSGSHLDEAQYARAAQGWAGFFDALADEAASL